MLKIQKLRNHIIIQIIVANWVAWGVLDCNESPAKTEYLSFAWVIMRLSQRALKHLYNIYIDMGLRFEIIYFDLFRFNSFYVLVPLEFMLSYALIVQNFAQIQ